MEIPTFGPSKRYAYDFKRKTGAKIFLWLRQPSGSIDPLDRIFGQAVAFDLTIKSTVTPRSRLAVPRLCAD